MAVFVLETQPARAPGEEHRSLRAAASPELVRSARWYTKVRWIAAAIFAIVGMLLAVPLGIGPRLGVLPVSRPMWILAAFLAAGNLPFWIAARRVTPDTSRGRVRAMLWGEIAVDLLSVTYLVHIVGSVDTFVSFFYLLHITLSCIALSTKESLLVALGSAVLYLGIVALETAGLLPYHPVFAMRLSPVRENPILALLFAASSVFLWLVIWYFISTIARSLRRREEELHKANRLLKEADEEKNRIMIQTTHDLKTPFFGIESNLQLLREAVWERLPESTRRVVDRIASQSRILRSRIDSILLYNELRSRTRRGSEPAQTVALSDLLDEAVEEVRARAAERNVSIRREATGIAVRCSRSQLGVLFTNLVSNAVAYSHEGGSVQITSRETAAAVVVSVQDEGIGIRPEALPHIFEEYFRTKEATRMNRTSSGLGLAIVKEIAMRNALTIRVISDGDKGTAFEVTIPKSESQEQLTGE